MDPAQAYELKWKFQHARSPVQKAEVYPELMAVLGIDPHMVRNFAHAANLIYPKLQKEVNKAWVQIKGIVAGSRVRKRLGGEEANVQYIRKDGLLQVERANGKSTAWSVKEVDKI